jgi:hypothetical protein
LRKRLTTGTTMCKLILHSKNRRHLRLVSVSKDANCIMWHDLSSASESHSVLLRDIRCCVCRRFDCCSLTASSAMLLRDFQIRDALSQREVAHWTGHVASQSSLAIGRMNSKQTAKNKLFFGFRCDHRPKGDVFQLTQWRCLPANAAFADARAIAGLSQAKTQSVVKQTEANWVSN